MTQSGQGEEPSARPAHEGIVLPSDGGQPLLPGTAGGAGGPVGPGGPPPGQPNGQAAAPAGGQAWGQPWGPDGRQTPAPQPEQGWQAPHAQSAPSWGSGSPEPYPPAPQAPWDAHGQAAGPLPPEGASAYGHQAGAPLPPATGPYAQAGPPTPYATDAHGAHAHGASSAGHGAALPPVGGTAPYGVPAGQQPPHGAHALHGGPAPGGDEGATQYLPPVGAAPVNEGATQYLPPVAAAPADEGATQYIPPVTPGAMPPEAPGGDASTRFLGRVPQGGPGPLPSAGPGGDPDAQATQFIAPVGAQMGGAPASPYGGGPGAAGGRQTPAEFDNLFRSDAGSTQQLPRFQSQDVPPGRPGVPGPGGPAGSSFGLRPVDDDGDSGRGGKRTNSRVPVIAAVGIGIVVLGVGAGALLSGGGGGSSDSTDKNANVSATADATDPSSASPAADPARAQAVELDKLLADSGSSRASVINAVADVRKCDNLDKAASDLRAAAKQRNDLVTRLGGLSVDKLPGHAALTSALNSAWKASASADQHYAAWAGQVGGKKGCKKGHARNTAETQQGNRQSGVASAQKVKAAQLWNAIAKKYGLTQRQPTQL
ncbi:hypothetical protein [Streptomyces carpinensis]|uniref:hypothetical protein n=1 Tax=Streptomyces carpinensis TaxID=66369 RepID=UPI000A3CAB8D|nr:hypothetical protein [Streptomyces carpinensis]